MVKTVIAAKAHPLPNIGLVELLYFSLSLLAYRGLANLDDMRVLKALLDELPRDEYQNLKAA